MVAILDFTRKRGFSQGEFGWVFFSVFLYSSTESNYVEKHLLTFFSIKYFSIFHLKLEIIHIFRSNYLTLTLFVTLVDLSLI